MAPRSKAGADRWALAVALAFAAAGCGDAGVAAVAEPPDPDPGEELLGGAGTVFDTTRDAFARPARNLTEEHRSAFSLGDHFFNRGWITAPASVAGEDGLGPTFNAKSCSGCHYKDGRGSPPIPPDSAFVALVLRLSVPGRDAHGGPLPEPTYGSLLGTQAILGVPVEGRPTVAYEEITGAFADGEPYTSRRPVYSIADLGYGPLDAQVATSPRIARQLIGLGLLEAIPEADVLANADPDDADGDGISGRPNRVWDVRRGRTVLGRFGWKADQPTVEQQAAGAFLKDIGITSTLFPQESCPPAQVECIAAPNGGSPELDAFKLARLTLYMRTVAVPARRDWTDREVVHGKDLFLASGCARCHVPKFVTGPVDDVPELGGQVVRPYSDLLLHDLGPGLADGRPEYEADGREWRTPPLWGIGLVPTVNRHTFYLNDGRARNLTEAILWHGGEATHALGTFLSMPADDRRALIRFLESL